jgi:hypothetical protein
MLHLPFRLEEYAAIFGAMECFVVVTHAIQRSDSVLVSAATMAVILRTTSLLVVLKPNRIIHKCTDANCSSFHLRVFLGLSNP